MSITTNRILEAFPESNVTIITSDHDYLQLVGPRVQLYSLKYKNLLESKKAYDDPKKNLFCKIVSGDKSDNIPGIFKRCGIKTIEKCYEDQDMFMEKCKKEEAGDQFELNNKLINFNEIPEELVSEFMASNWIE
jgi:5'-3' exonuclease